MRYYSDKVKKIFDSEDALADAEIAFDKAQEEKEAQEKELKDTREARAKEVEDALQKAREAEAHANKLLREFVRDYHSFHYTYRGLTDNFFDALWNLI